MDAGYNFCLVRNYVKSSRKEKALRYNSLQNVFFLNIRNNPNKTNTDILNSFSKCHIFIPFFFSVFRDTRAASDNSARRFSRCLKFR